MARTQLNTKQIFDGGIQKEDMDTITPNQAVITRIIAGSGVSLASSGIDSGTGDVVVTVSEKYCHKQLLPATIWEIVHNMNKVPSVVIFDSAGDEVYADIKRINENSIQIWFSSATAGEAHLN